MLIQQVGRILDYNSILDYTSDMEAATRVVPKVVFKSFNSDMVGLEGVLLDFIDETFLVGSHAAPDGLQSEVSFQIARILKFKDSFKQKTASKGYPTGENSDVAWARFVVLDNSRNQTKALLGRKMSYEGMLDSWNNWHGCLMDLAAPNSTPVSYPSAALEDAVRGSSYTDAILNTSNNGAYMITNTGYIGLGPLYAVDGDAIIIFNGASTPSILRRVIHGESIEGKHSTAGEEEEDVGTWRIIGTCYIHGFMDNEIASPEWQAKKETFWIV